MGALLCSLRKPSLKKLLKNNGFGDKPDGFVDHQYSEHRRTPSLEQMKPWCVKTQKRIRQLHPQEEEEEEIKPKKLTLKDCLIASPAGLKQDNCFINGGDHLHLSSQYSSKLHPSMTRVHPHFISSNPREGISMEGVVEGHSESDKGVLNKSQNEKSNRKVSFRLPADVIIFYPPE